MIPSMLQTSCMGTIQSRTNVRLGMTSQQCLVQAQLRLRITMHRIVSHGQNVGNEGADRAAACGALGLTSNQNTWNRWELTFFMQQL